MIGIESSHGFGDCVFNVPLIKAICDRHNDFAHVAVQKQCADAFDNVPFIKHITHIPAMGHGLELFRREGLDRIYQITQNAKFFHYKQMDQHHSLIDTPKWVGLEIGINLTDQRPIIYFSDEETAYATAYGRRLDDRKVIAIESVAKSGQTWADKAAIKAIVDAHIETHKILWLSNEGAPHHKNIDILATSTRRKNILLLQYCDTFFSVGSGFFCGSLALPPALRPKRTVCMWIDDLYRYERRVLELRLLDNITWVHNMTGLRACLGLPS